jgi:multidrug efflux pump subunit AcrB
MIVLMFNAVPQTIIIFLCLPLATIGVTIGLLLFDEPFGFMCILGFLGLSGMLIKNAVVLIDQIDMEIKSGKSPFAAILDSSVSRLRPVTMAALTTVLGMLPLLKDVFYVGMSVTIMGGLIFGTVLTLVVVPVLYAVFFRIRPQTKSVHENHTADLVPQIT